MKKGNCLIFAVLFATFFMTGCKGSFNSVAQACSTVEAGAKVNLTECVSYNQTDIKSVRVLDDGNFDNKKPGTYAVNYEFTNVKDKTKAMSFEYSVVDTTKPTINVINEKIYVKQHDKFSIDDYVKASDNSNNVKLDISGNIDPEKEGTYNLKICAVDGSGNKSDQKSLEVTVENRDNCVFRNAKFGDSIETVKRYENAKFSSEDNFSDGKGKFLAYDVTLNNLQFKMYYLFNEKGELYKTSYVSDEIHVNANDYIDDYYEMKELLEKKYGKPNEDKKIEDSYAKWCTDEGQAIYLGYETLYATWKNDDYDILTMATSDDEYGIMHDICYESKNIEWPEDDISGL